MIIIRNFFIKNLFILILRILKNKRIKEVFKRLIVNVIYSKALKGINKFNL